MSIFLKVRIGRNVNFLPQTDSCSHFSIKLILCSGTSSTRIKIEPYGKQKLMKQIVHFARSTVADAQTSVLVFNEIRATFLPENRIWALLMRSWSGYVFFQIHFLQQRKSIFFAPQMSGPFSPPSFLYFLLLENWRILIFFYWKSLP